MWVSVFIDVPGTFVELAVSRRMCFPTSSWAPAVPACLDQTCRGLVGLWRPSFQIQRDKLECLSQPTSAS